MPVISPSWIVTEQLQTLSSYGSCLLVIQNHKSLGKIAGLLVDAAKLTVAQDGAHSSSSIFVRSDTEQLAPVCIDI